MFTPWGYEVESLPPLLTVGEFNQATGNAHAHDARLTAAVEAASAAIRNECGWHIAPNIPCVATLNARGRVAKLPANLVTEVTKVTEDGNELDANSYEARRDGLLRHTCRRSWSPKWGGVVVEYRAGYETVPELKSIAIRAVEAALAVPTGIASESAGGVSISYASHAATFAAAAIGGSRSALSPYRLVSSHAT